MLDDTAREYQWRFDSPSLDHPYDLRPRRCFNKSSSRSRSRMQAVGRIFTVRRDTNFRRSEFNTEIFISCWSLRSSQFIHFILGVMRTLVWSIFHSLNWGFSLVNYVLRDECRRGRRIYLYSNSFRLQFLSKRRGPSINPSNKNFTDVPRIFTQVSWDRKGNI